MESQESSTDSSSIPAFDTPKCPLDTTKSSSQETSTEQAEQSEKEESLSVAQDNLPVLMFGNGSPVKGSVKSAHFEFGKGSLSVETEVIPNSGSAESTNNMITTGKVVHIAIEQTYKDTHENRSKTNSSNANEGPDDSNSENVENNNENCPSSENTVTCSVNNKNPDSCNLHQENSEMEQIRNHDKIGNSNVLSGNKSSVILEKEVKSRDISEVGNVCIEDSIEKEDLNIRSSEVLYKNVDNKNEISISVDTGTDSHTKTKSGQEENKISLNISEHANNENIDSSIEYHNIHMPENSEIKQDDQSSLLVSSELGSKEVEDLQRNKCTDQSSSYEDDNKQIENTPYLENEKMEVEDDYHSSNDSKVVFPEASSDCDTFSVSIENFEVSIFEKDGSEDMTQRIDESTPNSTIESEINTKRKEDVFKLDEAFHFSDNEYSLNNMDCDVEEESLKINENYNSPSISVEENSNNLNEDLDDDCDLEETTTEISKLSDKYEKELSITEKSCEDNEKEEIKTCCTDETILCSDEGKKQFTVNTEDFPSVVPSVTSKNNSENEFMETVDNDSTEEGTGISEKMLLDERHNLKQENNRESFKPEEVEQESKNYSNSSKSDNNISSNTVVHNVSDKEIQNDSKVNNIDTNDNEENRIGTSVQDDINMEIENDTTTVSALINNNVGSFDSESENVGNRPTLIDQMQLALTKNEEFRKKLTLELNESMSDIKDTSKNADNNSKEAEVIVESSDSETEPDNTPSSSTLTDLVQSALAKNEKFRKNLTSEVNESVINIEKTGQNTVDNSKETEVISLVDDDDDENRKKKPAAAINCINPNCMSGEGLAKPAMFVLTYFGMKRAKNQQVCAECFNMVLEHQENLAVMLKEGKPLFSSEFPCHKDVILLDSDEESFSDDDSVLSEDTMEMIRDNIDDVIAETLVKYNLDHQIRESCHILDNKFDNIEEEVKEINKRFDQVQQTIDDFRKSIYEDFKQPIEEVEEVHFTDCEIPPMPIRKSKTQNQLYNKQLQNQLRRMQQERESEVGGGSGIVPTRSIATKRVSQMSSSSSSSQSSYDGYAQDVIAVHSESKIEPPSDLPPPGPLLRPKLKVGDLAYTMKVSYFSIWVLARVVEVIPRNTSENDSSTETYRVRVENVKKNTVRTVTGKYLAYPKPARVQLPVGTRVIAIFKEEDERVENRENYYVGVIAEPPKITNKYRYLVFFDDGYTQYCPHKNILMVCNSNKNVWEDIHPEPRDFIRNYLQQYPERPMVKLYRGQVVKVEWNGRWWIVRVLEVDASLVKVHFDADKRTEWIYRGSTRLGPMFKEISAAKERQSGSLLRSRGFGTASAQKGMPYVEYTRGDGDDRRDGEKSEEKEDEQKEEVTVVPTRSVARKSTAKKPVEPVISNTQYSKPLISHIPQGTVTQRKLKNVCTPFQFRPHQCNNSCVNWTDYSPAAAKKYDPLIKPLVFGFARLTVNFRGKTAIQYKAPCGRMIRTQQEMLCYLQGTKSALTIDFFDFDFWVNPLSEFQESKTFCRIEDLSYGKENVPISCVNELDHSMPQYVQYMTARKPAKDVHLNLDPEFLVGCDCTDDCDDRNKCSCWKLTMQGKAYIPDGDLDPLFGYQFRRLPERIATGIYECNSRCKCSATCQNRVAQQPLSFRLQLFKTPKKGWGIRSLHDIPRGTFICIYVGFLLTDQEANEGGKTYGDEYLAELDYIESVENLKEGYESEAREPSDFDDDDDDDNRDIDTMDIEYEDDQHSLGSEVEETSTTRREDIRLRLRRRLPGENEKESSRKYKSEDDTISISDDEADTVRKPQTFNASITKNDDLETRFPSVRDFYGKNESVYIMDAKTHGNIGRYLNHSCSPNVFVQNVFVDTHDLRFPWVAFFANQYISAGTELTWDYNYDVGSVPGKVMLCYCNSNNCRGRLL